jgi:hypothetical protein
LRVRAVISSWGEPLDGMILIQFFHYTVDPAKTQRFFHSIVVRDMDLTGGFVGKDQPDFLFRLEVAFKPIPPLITVLAVKCFHVLSFLKN